MPSSALNLPVAPGDVIAGKYVIDRLLGQGGMGAVFLARQEQLHRSVAIKVLLPSIAEKSELLARFEREARAAAALTSDHVSKVFDVGQLPSGAPYIVMELLEGDDLGVVLERSGPLAIDLAVKVILEACDAIAEAHNRKIVHRDLKPANLFLATRANGTTITKVLDFGISKANPDIEAPAITKTSAVLGSAFYMSPEQFHDVHSADPRSDIWALGVTLYECLTGVLPFVGAAFTEVCARVLTATPVPVREHRPDVPPALEAIVMRCLAKDPPARYGSIAELVAALQSFLAVPVGSVSSLGALLNPGGAKAVPSGSGRGSGDTRAAGPRSIEAALTSIPVSSPFAEQLTVPMSSPWRPFAFGSVALLAVVGGIGLGLHRRGGGEPVRAGPTTEAMVPPVTSQVPALPLPEAPAPLPEVTSSSSAKATPPLSEPSIPPKPNRPVHPAAPAASLVVSAPIHDPSAANCDPSFTLDAKGQKHWKPECFRKP